LRAAAKNHRHVLVANSPRAYEPILLSLRGQDRSLEIPHLHLIEAIEVFNGTTRYDAAIADWMSDPAHGSDRPHTTLLEITEWEELRYGENPHQTGRLIGLEDEEPAQNLTTADARFCDSQPRLSLNNYVDADAALALCSEMTRARKEEKTAVFIKHTNACG